MADKVIVMDDETRSRGCVALEGCVTVLMASSIGTSYCSTAQSASRRPETSSWRFPAKKSLNKRFTAGNACWVWSRTKFRRSSLLMSMWP